MSHRLPAARSLVAAGLLGALAAGSVTALAADNLLILVGQGAGTPGAVVHVPLLLMMVPGSHGDPSDVSGLDLTLEWDPAIASLVSIERTSETAAWQLAYNAAAGTVRVSLASLDGVAATAIGIDVLHFSFVLADVGGETALRLASTRAFDGHREPIDHVTVDGRLVVSSVPVADPTWGKLKSTYGASLW